MCIRDREEYRKAAVDAVAQLSKDVKIPQDLKEIVKEEDLDFLVDSAYNDACAPGNPKDASKEDIKALYLSLIHIYLFCITALLMLRPH